MGEAADEGGETAEDGGVAGVGVPRADALPQAAAVGQQPAEGEAVESLLPGEQGVCAVAHFRVQPPGDVEACDGVVQQGEVFAGQSETGEDGFAVEQGGYFVGFEAAVEQFQHLFQRVEQGTAAAEFDVGYGIRQRPSALFAEDGFDKGDVGFDVGREDGDVVGVQVGMAVELFEQVFFEDLQFAQRAVGADDADAVVGCGRAVGQGEGFCSICAGSMMLPQYSAAGLRAKMCTSLCCATACNS